MFQQLLALAAVVAAVSVMAARVGDDILPLSRGGDRDDTHLVSWSGHRAVLDEEPVYADKATTAKDQKALAVLEKHIPPLSQPLNGHWPIVVWASAGDNRAEWDAWIERGISPLFNGCSSPVAAQRLAPQLRHFQNAGVPLIILAQGWVQRAFHGPPHGTGCEHLPPARPARYKGGDQDPHRHCTCPSWMLENPALPLLADNVRATCQTLADNGIRPASFWLDFESGVYLRNGAEAEKDVLLAAAETARCPRCRQLVDAGRFGSAMAYSALAQEVRAKATKMAFVDPVHDVWPDLPTGNFFAWPIRRLPFEPAMYPAYGYDGSGFTVAQPRCYFTPGWGGGGTDQAATDWGVFYYCIERFSRCASVLREDEIMVPWVGWLWSNPGALKGAARKRCINSPHGYREMAIHTLLRGARTIAVFEPSRPNAELRAEYDYAPRHELGPFVLNVLDIQQGLDAILPHADLIARGRILNLEIGGLRTELTDDSVCWSGTATDDLALVRTVTFKTDQEREIEVFGRTFTLPFKTRGRFFHLYPDGRIEPLD